MLPLILGRLVGERAKVERVTWTSTGADVTATAEDEDEDEDAINATAVRMAQDGADVTALVERLTDLKALRTQLGEAAPSFFWTSTGQSVAEALDLARDDEERHTILAEQVETLSVHRGRTGRYLDPARVRISWKPEGHLLPDGTRVIPSDVKPGQIGTIGGFTLRLGRERYMTY